MERTIVVLAGPTAVGKTEYAVQVAACLNGEVLSADSMQIYKHMDIGSAKPGKDQLDAVAHHLVGEVDPFLEWSAARYQKEAKSRIEQIFSRGKLPVISGGTGLYINALIYNMDFSKAKGNQAIRGELESLLASRGKEALYLRLKEADPEAAERIHPNNIKKIIRAIEVAESTGQGIPAFERSFEKTGDYGCIMIGLNRNREVLYRRIEARVDQMLEAGLVSEVEGLLKMGLTEDYNSMKGIGYKEIIGYLKGRYSLEESIKQMKQNSRNYAKRQMTWFRRYEDMVWFNLTDERDFKENAGEIIGHIRDRLGPGIKGE